MTPLALATLVAVCAAPRQTSSSAVVPKRFMNSWSVKIFGGEEVAKNVAQGAGFTFLGPVKFLNDYYTFSRPELEERSEKSGVALNKILMDIDEVQWSGQDIYIKVDLGKAPKRLKHDPDSTSVDSKRSPPRRTFRMFGRSKRKYNDPALTVLAEPGVTTDREVGQAYAYGKDKFDIFSNAWGQYTDGRRLLMLNQMEAEGIRKGVEQGRNGKGAIFLMGAGNSKHLGDGCAFGAVANNPYIILVGAANQYGKATHYSNQCANLFATAYSDDGSREEGVVATLPNNACTLMYGGTSAATSIASGIIALILQKNPKLTYRDVQHLITMAAEVAPLADNPGTWRRNAGGFWVSQDFGFGLLNAQNMAVLAQNWKKVPAQKTNEKVFNFNPFPEIRYGSMLNVELNAEDAGGIVFLERVTIGFSIAFDGPRGILVISLESPQGTETQLIKQRSNDVTRARPFKWWVTSSHLWGERPAGKWKLKISLAQNTRAVGTLNLVSMKLFGMTSFPDHYSGSRENYATFRPAP